MSIIANQSASQGQVVDLDDVFNSSFQSKFFQASWTPGIFSSYSVCVCVCVCVCDDDEVVHKQTMHY